jgi:hypothetical protein
MTDLVPETDERSLWAENKFKNLPPFNAISRAQKSAPFSEIAACP